MKTTNQSLAVLHTKQITGTVFTPTVVKDIEKIQGASLSPGTSISVFGTPNDYCIKAFNVNGKEYMSHANYALYQSATGKVVNAASVTVPGLSCNTVEGKTAFTLIY